MENSMKAMNLSPEFLVVCTDRGQHPNRILGRFRLGENGARGNVQHWLYSSPDPVTGVKTEVINIGGTGLTWVFKCPSCRRNEQAKADRLQNLADTLYKSGVLRFDISSRC
jgi:hypothetical protein